jgi:hypothetical protein
MISFALVIAVVGFESSACQLHFACGSYVELGPRGRGGAGGRDRPSITVDPAITIDKKHTV